MRIFGRLITDAGEPLVGWLVRAEDEVWWKYSLAATKTGDDGEFVLESSATPSVRALPPLTFYISEGDRPVHVVEPPLSWSKEGDAEVELVVAAAPQPDFYLYGRVRSAAADAGVGGLIVEASDRHGAFDPQRVQTGERGLFEVWWPYKQGSQPDPELRVLRGQAAVPSYATPITWDANRSGAVSVDIVWEVSGAVVDRATGEGVAGARVEAWDSEVWLAAAHADATGAFTLHLPRQSGQSAPPQPTFRVYRDGQLIETITAPVPWDEAGFATVQLRIGNEAKPLPTIYTISGTAVDRVTRRGVPDLRVEAWTGDATFMLAVAETAEDGRFAVTLQSEAGEQAPQPRFRFYRDGQLVAQPDMPVIWRGAGAAVFVEVDVPPDAPRSFQISGRVIDESARSGLAGLRVEAWDKAPRDGGALGVAAVTGSDGSFEIFLPGRQDGPVARTAPNGRIPPGGRTPPIVSPRPIEVFVPTLADDRLPTIRSATSRPLGPPTVFFRIYGQERLLVTTSPEISWTPEGIGTTVVEMAAPAAISKEVGLHEFGESVASTVDRVQTELARYPKTMGAYVLDEIDLNVPVEMRVDEVGQVRTKVIDATTPEKSVGQMRMKVRPVIGSTQPPSEVRDQPLEVLDELAPAAIARLEAQRIYSVEDLARAASSAAGRAAIEALDLGADLDALLAKAALLAFRPLPRAIREALIRLGVTSLGAFAGDPNQAALATKLSELLEQTFTEADVAAWQATVKKAHAVPRPSEAAPAPEQDEHDDPK
jgi:hypothetical protein